MINASSPALFGRFLRHVRSPARRYSCRTSTRSARWSVGRKSATFLPGLACPCPKLSSKRSARAQPPSSTIRPRPPQPAAALEVFGGMDWDWSKALPANRAVYAATLAANGKKDQAIDLTLSIASEQLRSEERALLPTQSTGR